MTVSLPLDSEEPLARHQDRAEARLNAARDEHHRMQLINVARIITAALPAASSIDLARHMFDFQDELWLEAVYTADGTLLWRDEPDSDPSAEFRYANGATWTQAIEVIIETVTQALAGEEITTVAKARPDWSRPASTGPIELFRISLPDRAAVEHHTRTPPEPADEPRKDPDAGAAEEIPGLDRDTEISASLRDDTAS